MNIKWVWNNLKVVNNDRVYISRWTLPYYTIKKNIYMALFLQIKRITVALKQNVLAHYVNYVYELLYTLQKKQYFCLLFSSTNI